MTAVDTEPVSAELAAPTAAAVPAEVHAAASGPGPEPVGSRRIVTLVLVWLAVGLALVGLVVYAIEPLFQARAQERLLDAFRGKVERAANEAQGLPGIETPTKAVELGQPVAIVEVPRLSLRQVVVEGVGAGETTVGPGHVPGTAGLGQPGSAVVVGRRAAFGAPFGDLATLQEGDEIAVTTTQGQVGYRVTAVRTVVLRDPTDATASGASTGEGDAASAAADAAAGNPGSVATDGGPETVTVDEVYGPTDIDRLNLVTSASNLPGNGSEATVVHATLLGKPFLPTPQNGRVDSQTGQQGDPGAWLVLLLLLQLFVVTAVAGRWLFRRDGPAIAYLVVIAPLLALTLLLGETLGRLLPAWT